MIDIHSHILPGIDDGAKDIEESISILREMKAQGITTVVATPHFYIQDQSLEDFLANRNEAYNKLLEVIDKDEELPKIILGSEAYFSPALSDIDVSELCIGDSDYFILELPYQEFTSSVIRQINDFINRCDKIPIFAHLERYFRFTSLEKIMEVYEYGVLAQMNSSSLLVHTGKKASFELIKRGCIQVIGTDAHNLTSRPPSMSFAKRLLDKKIGNDFFEGMQKKAQAILDNDEYDTVISM